MQNNSQRKKYVVDGNNICFMYSNVENGVISLRPLITLLLSILENGDDFKVVFDASIASKLIDSGQTKGAELVKRLCKDNSHHFFIVTGSTRADGVILHEADEFNLSVISSDLYRDYKSTYSWLNIKYPDRLIPGNLQPNGLMTFEKLTYGRLNLLSQDEIENAIKRLLMLLSGLTNPEISEMDILLREKRSQLATLKTEFTDIQDAIRREKVKLSESKQHPLHDSEPYFAEKVSWKAPEAAPKAANEEMQRIFEANAALQAFLRPFGLPQSHFEFKGYSWEYAVKLLKQKFETSKPCSNCYESHNRHVLDIDGWDNDRCQKCYKGEHTNKPQTLWRVVNNFAPVK